MIALEARRRWLVGELDDQVALPIGYVCDMLGLDAGVLAAAVRARATPTVVAVAVVRLSGRRAGHARARMGSPPQLGDHSP